MEYRKTQSKLSSLHDHVGPPIPRSIGEPTTNNRVPFFKRTSYQTPRSLRSSPSTSTPKNVAGTTKETPRSLNGPVRLPSLRLNPPISPPLIPPTPPPPPPPPRRIWNSSGNRYRPRSVAYPIRSRSFRSADVYPDGPVKMVLASRNPLPTAEENPESTQRRGYYMLWTLILFFVTAVACTIQLTIELTIDVVLALILHSFPTYGHIFFISLLLGEFGIILKCLLNKLPSNTGDIGLTEPRPPTAITIYGAPNWEGAILDGTSRQQPQMSENISSIPTSLPPAYGVYQGTIRIADRDIRYTDWPPVSDRHRLVGRTYDSANSHPGIYEYRLDELRRPPSYVPNGPRPSIR